MLVIQIDTIVRSAPTIEGFAWERAPILRFLSGRDVDELRNQSPGVILLPDATRRVPEAPDTGRVLLYRIVKDTIPPDKELFAVLVFSPWRGYRAWRVVANAAKSGWRVEERRVYLEP